MLSIGSYSPHCNKLSEEELILAKEHRVRQKKSELFRTRFFSECKEERATAAETWREMRNNNEFIRDGISDTWRKAVGVMHVAHLHCLNNPTKFSATTIPRVPAFQLSNQSFSFNDASNTISIGIGSRIQMDGYFLEVLENSVVALTRLPDGTYAHVQSTAATALNSLLRGIGVDATWGYDSRTKDITMSFLEKIGVDTSRPFFINGTQFELQGNKLRTIGQTTQQELQFWGFEGLNRLVAQAYAQNLLVSPGV